MQDQFTYSIRDLEAVSGIPAHTIRTWERRFRLFVPRRDGCNVRWYTSEDLAFLNHLVLLLRQGYRISALACKTREQITQLARDSVHTALTGDFTESVCLALQDMDVQKTEGILRCLIKREGIDNVLRSRVAPFLDQVGLLMLSGTLEPVHLHLFFAALREKLYASTAELPAVPDGVRWLLVHHQDFGADSIWPDILRYLLKKRGGQVMVLPVIELKETQRCITQWRPAYVMVITATEEAWQKLVPVADAIPTKQGNTLVFVPGKTPDFVNTAQIAGIEVLSGLEKAFHRLTTA